jgi:hypothetical protein
VFYGDYNGISNGIYMYIYIYIIKNMIFAD